MDDTKRIPSSTASRTESHDHKEKENSRIPTIRSSLPTSLTRKSLVSTLPFQFVESTNRSKKDNDDTKHLKVSEQEELRSTISSHPTTTAFTSTKATNTAIPDDSCPISNESASRTSSLSSSTIPVLLTTIPATISSSETVNFDASSPVGNHSCDGNDHPFASTMIKSIMQQYPTRLKDASKINKFQQVLMSLTTNDNDSSTTTGSTPLTTTNEAIADVFHMVMTDMLQLQQMLFAAEGCITELQNINGHFNPSNHEPSVVETMTACDCDTTELRIEDNGITNDDPRDSCETVATILHDGDNDVSVLQERIKMLEKKLLMSSVTIDQLKNQKQHIITNTKKKKLVFDEMERKVLIMEKDLQTVMSERNSFRNQLQDMTELRDSYKQKLRNQQEIVKDSKQAMMEYKHKLQKTEHMRSLENELLDNFRKLAIHTGFYRWGKPIRLLEVAIAAAAIDFEETTSGTFSTSTGEDDFE